MLQAENDSNEDEGHDKYKNAETLKRQRRGELILKQLYRAEMNFYLLQLFFFFASIIFYYQVVNRPNPQKNLTSSNVNTYIPPTLCFFYFSSSSSPTVRCYTFCNTDTVVKETTSKRLEECHNYDSSSSVVFNKCYLDFHIREYMYKSCFFKVRHTLCVVEITMCAMCVYV